MGNKGSGRPRSFRIFLSENERKKILSLKRKKGLSFQAKVRLNIILAADETKWKKKLSYDEDYRALETALQERIDGIGEEYEGYDEYIVTCDQIGHDPYELAAYLTVLFENYTREEVRDACKELFDSQYVLETEETTETRTGTHQVTDPETGESYDENYDYDVGVEYDY